MKHAALRCAVTALLLLGLAPAHGADSSYWYAGLGVGYSRIQFYPADFARSGAAESKKEFDAGFKGFIGEQINRNWAGELSFVQLGKFSYNSDLAGDSKKIIYKVTGWGFSVLPTIPLTQNLSFFGRMGAFFSQTRTKVRDQNSGAVSPSLQSDEVNFLTGIGMQYYLNAESGVRVEFENFGKVGEACGNPCTGRANAKMISVNAVFAF